MGLRDRVLSGIKAVIQKGSAPAPAPDPAPPPPEAAPTAGAATPVAASSSLPALDQVAQAAKSLAVSATVGSGGGAIEIEARQTNSTYGTYAYGSAKSGRQTRAHVRATSLGDAVQKLASKCTEWGALDIDSIACSSSQSPLKGAALKHLVVSAVCEAFGVTVPTEEELAVRRKAAQSSAREEQASSRARRKELLQLLAAGGSGVEQWKSRLPEAERLAPFKKANLDGADLGGVRLVSMPEGSFTGARLGGADLSKGDFSKAAFQHAVLRDASLFGASFKKADLTGADLEGANLARALLQGAVLADAKLAGAILDKAQFDGDTVWPTGFVPPEGLLWVGKGPNPAALAAIAIRKKSEGPIDAKAFMARLEKTIDKPRLAKALSMLKHERFQLFVEVGDARLAGIVKSQSDPDLVYSCALAADGQFGCCTQNLNVCGGLRGALCKHLLVLAIGLTQAGQIDADTLDDWVQRSGLRTPALDKEAMSAILLRYKGAEAGEIDWRPTETLPEDFYAY